MMKKVAVFTLSLFLLFTGISFLPVNISAAPVGAESNKEVQLFSRETTSSVTLTDETLTTLATINTSGKRRLYIQIDVATTALDQFIISNRAHTQGTYQSMFSTSGDYTGPTGILIGTSGDLTAITAGNSGWFIMNVIAIEQVQVQVARAAGSNAVITYYAGAE